MVILGLTGSIGMGKTTAAAMLRRLRLPVHDADAVVHGLLGPGGAAVAAVAGRFPDAVRDGAVDRRALGDAVFDDDAALADLEAILHPMVRRSERRFLEHCARRRESVAVLDIPLLFETGAEARCDAVLVVTCSALLQRRRVLRRPGMTVSKFNAILARQVPAADKQQLADFVVVTGLGKGYTLQALGEAVRLARRARGRVWRPSRQWPRHFARPATA